MKRAKRTALAACLLFFSGSYFSQVSKKDSLDNVYRKDRRYERSRKDFEMSPEALDEFLYYRHNNRAGIVLSSVGSCLFLTSAFTTGRNQNFSYGMLGGGCLALCSGLIFTINASKHFRKAVNYRSRADVSLALR